MNGRSHRGQSAGFDPAPPSHHQPIIMAPWIARRPSRAPPDPWEGQQVAYVGQDPLCGSSGGCSQQRSSARSAVTSSMGIGFSASHLLGPSSHNAGRVSDDGGRGGCNRDHVGAVDVPAVGASPQVVGDVHVQRCQVHSCPELPSYSTEGRLPAVSCGAHCGASTLRVMGRVESICGVEGCGLPTEIHQISASGKIERLCSRHRGCLEVSDAYKACCEYSGCTDSARYGPKEGPLTFCQHHKRAGMFTIRDGKLLVATRDGRAFRPGGASSVGSGEDEGVNRSGSGGGSGLDGHLDGSGDVGGGRGRGSSKTRRRTTPTPAVHYISRGVPSAGTNGSAVDNGMMMIVGEGGTLTRPGNGGGSRIVRKLCEIPGCPVQPSYGPQGTKRPRFCTGHKGPGMIALKNRPCLYPGCDTRPHYGISGGRAVYCAQHMKRGMVHLLKEQLTKEKENQSRKRTEARNLKIEQRAKAREEAKIAGQTASKAARQNKAYGDEGKEHDGEDKEKKGQEQEDIDDRIHGRKETEAHNEEQEQESESNEDDDGKQDYRYHKPKRPRIATRTTGRTAAATARGKRAKPKGKGKSVAWGKNEPKAHQRANATADNEDNDDDDDDGYTASNVRPSSDKRQASSPPVVSAAGRGQGKGRRSEVPSPASSVASPAEQLAAVSPAAPPSSASSRPSSAASGDDGARTGIKPKTGKGVGFAFGRAPSTEIRLLQKARESARVEAAAVAAGGGSSRRARAPSLKALEAAGMVEEGAQWMNKEMKEEHARQIRESKEKRKAAAEAGLKTGVVFEEPTVGSGHPASGTVGGGSAGVGSRHDVVCGDGGGANGGVGFVEGGGAESGAGVDVAAGGSSRCTMVGGKRRKFPVQIRPQAEEKRSHSEALKMQQQQGQQGQHRATVTNRLESASEESGVGTADKKGVATREVQIDACSNSGTAAVETTATVADGTETADGNTVGVRARTAAAGNNDVNIPSAENNEGEECESAGGEGEGRHKPRGDAGKQPDSSGMEDEDVPAHFAAATTVPERFSERGRNRNNDCNRREEGYNNKHGEEGGSEECKKKPTRRAKKFGGSRAGAFSGRKKGSNKGKAKDAGKGKGRDDGAGGVGGRSAALEDARPVTECDFAACSRSATFGVNGTVRYCKAHRLFGMHEITDGR